MKHAIEFTSTQTNMKVIPVVSLPEDYFIHEVESSIEIDFFKRVHSTAVKTYSQVANSSVVDDNIDPYGPFGWRRTGGIVVMHTNTPNNTLPLIHNKSKTWNPLFKRHKRV